MESLAPARELPGTPLGRSSLHPRLRRSFRSGSQPLRMNDTKNPAAVAIEFRGRPCSKASGISVSASEASTAPPAKASGNARCSSGNWANTPRPKTTAPVSSTAVSNQIAIAKDAERPPRRIATAPTRDSGKFEQKMATSSARLPPPESSETPSARFSGTPSSVTAAKSAKPTAALPAGGGPRPPRPPQGGGCCVEKDKAPPPSDNPQPRRPQPPEVDRLGEQLE